MTDLAPPPTPLGRATLCVLRFVDHPLGAGAVAVATGVVILRRHMGPWRALWLAAVFAVAPALHLAVRRWFQRRLADAEARLARAEAENAALRGQLAALRHDGYR